MVALDLDLVPSPVFIIWYRGSRDLCQQRFITVNYSHRTREYVGNDIFYVLLKWVARLNYRIFYIRVDNI